MGRMPLNKEKERQTGCSAEKADDALHDSFSDMCISPMAQSTNCVANPLVVPEFSTRAYHLFSPAVNCSGDIYHMAAYQLVCHHFAWHVPDVFLGWDVNETYGQAVRGLNFMSIIGLEGKCHIINPSEVLEEKDVSVQSSRSFHSSVRSKKMRRALAKQNIIACDQKITTSFLNSAYQNYGNKITEVLKEGFLDRPAKLLPPDICHAIDQSVSEQQDKVKKFVGESSFILLHERYSHHANAQQDLSEQAINSIRVIAQSRRIKVFVICTTDIARYMKKNDLSDCIVPFAPLKYSMAGNTVTCDSKYDKYRHMKLLFEISKLTGFVGVVGGTSGTLDVAALLGLRVFDLHSFAQSNKAFFSPNVKTGLIKYQDLRVCLQTVFMFVCRNPFIDQVREEIHKFRVSVASLVG